MFWYWYQQLLQITNQDPLYFQRSPRNLTLPHKLSVNHNIAEKIYNYLLGYQYIANLIIKLNNWHPILNISLIEVFHVLGFLSGRFDKGHAYSTIDSAKRAIATITYIPPCNSLNKHQLINKYMAGVFNSRTPNPKLSFVWDVDILLSYFEQQGGNNSLSDELLTQKLLISLLLLGTHKISAIK